MKRLALALAALALAAVGACSALTNLDDLRSSDAGSTIDAPSDVAIDASADASPDAGPIWVDDFNRADSTTIGNSWIMKTANSFHILSDEVERISTNGVTDYRDNVVYRPPAEDVADVAVSAEFRLTGTPPGYPQIMARIQQSTVQTADTLDCYMVFVDDQVKTAIIGRQTGTSYLTTLATINLSPGVDTTQTFRLVLSVKGSGPVALVGEVDRWDAPSTSWVSIGGASLSDTDPAMITTPGSVGFSGGTPESDGLYFYDNFTRAPL
jgi:hypothetical protein